MLKRIILKTKLADDRPFSALLKVIYFNLIKINKFIIYEFDLTQSFDSPSLNKPEWEIKVIYYKELEKYLPKGKHLPREFKMYEIDGVKYCVLILKNTQISHIHWIYMKGDQNRWFDLKDEEASINYAFTFHDFRGQGLFPQAILASARWLKKKGFIKILEAPHEGTISTIKSFHKIPNLKKVGTLTHWCFYRPKFIPKAPSKD